MDFILAILPWPVIMGLNMKRKEKITIACGLSLGVFAGACSVARTIELRTLANKENYVHDTSPMLLWSSSEICLTVVCACIPVLRPLYVRTVYGSRGESSDGGGRRSYPLKEYSDSKKSSGYQGSGRARVYMGRGESALHTTVKLGAVNASEETILRDCHKASVPESTMNAEAGVGMSTLPKKNDIRVTTTVEVEERIGDKFLV